MVDIALYSLAFLTKPCRYAGQSLCDIDQQILHPRNIRFLAADT